MGSEMCIRDSPYKDQFIKDNAGSASIWVKDFSRNSKYKKNTTVFGFTNYKNKIFNNFKYINLKFSKFGIQSNNLQYVNKFIDVLSLLPPDAFNLNHPFTPAPFK